MLKNSYADVVTKQYNPTFSFAAVVIILATSGLCHLNKCNFGAFAETADAVLLGRADSDTVQ